MMTSNLKQRRQWMAILAQSQSSSLEQLWTSLKLVPDYQLLRPTQVGLVQLQGRMEVEGARFVLGDMTVSRAAIQLKKGASGYSYVIGRDRAHAERCAVVDALLQDDKTFSRLWDRLILPLSQQQQARQACQQRDVAASRVNFFTLVRGE